MLLKDEPKGKKKERKKRKKNAQRPNSKILKHQGSLTYAQSQPTMKN